MRFFSSYGKKTHWTLNANQISFIHSVDVICSAGWKRGKTFNILPSWGTAALAQLSVKLSCGLSLKN